MSKYTTQIRFIVENFTQEMEGQPISKRIETACPKVFNFDFPIWLESYRPILEKKILMHYFNKEIGLETYALWKLYLEERLNLIMPYYNKMYETTVKDYDYMTNINDEETYTGKKQTQEDGKYNAKGNSDFHGESADTFHGSGISEDNGTNTTNKKELSSDLPQANYANVDYGTNLVEGEQSGTTKNNGSTQSDSNGTNEQDTTTTTTQESTNNLKGVVDDTFTRKRKGVTNIPLTDLLMKYRESLINIDVMVINELQDLFMTIY